VRLASLSDFEKELSQTPWNIFHPLTNLGFYKWVPSPDSADQRLEDVQGPNESFTSMIDLDGTPNELIEPSSLSFPIIFPSDSSPQIHKCCYPYGQLDIPGLYVATNHHGVDLSDLDFVLGGTSLNMLATQTTLDDFFRKDAMFISYYYAVRIPGSKTIMVAKRKVYDQDYSSPSFQFERLVTGENMEGEHSVHFAYHLHTMKVGENVVLFNAETDALYRGSPVEIKANKPKYWGAKVFFQMISTGSPVFCHGRRNKVALRRVKLWSLSRMAKWVDSSVPPVMKGERNHVAMQQNILKGMQSLKLSMSHAEEGQAFRIRFSSDGNLILDLMNDMSTCMQMLPPNSVVRSLVGSRDKD